MSGDEALADPFGLEAPAARRRQCVVGIDPGSHGAMAQVELGAGWDFLDAVDMPIRDRGKTVTNNVLDARRFAAQLGLWNSRAAIKFVVVEDVQPMPSRERGEGEPERVEMPARHAFTFGGFCLGIPAVCEALGYEVLLVRPQQWKKAAGLRRVGDRTRSDVKAESLQRAREVWPSAPLELAKHENRAEAALIGRFGISSQMRIF